MTPAQLLPFTIAFVVMTLLGYFVTSIVCSRRFSPPMVWAWAPITGAGTCSLIGFVFRRPMFTIEFALLLIFFTLWLLKRRIKAPDLSSLLTWRAPILGVLLAAALGWAFSQSLVRVEKTPHGAWDGYAIWNSHARYLYRDGPGWQQGIQNTFHADYPLLQPLLTVRLWRYTGTDVPDMGGVFGGLFALCGIALLCVVLKELRGTSIGILMGMVLISTPLYLIHALDQEADAMFSIFFLATIASLALYFERMPDAPGVLVLSGFMAGCAGWTKNEGLLFILATSMVLLVPILWTPAATLRRFAAFAAGLAIPLAVIIFFKITVAPQSDLTWNRHYAEIVDKLRNPDRYLIIFGNMLRTSWTFGGWSLQPMIPLLAFLALKGIDRPTLRRFPWLAGTTILAMVLAGYFAVYVLTPMDLQWHLDSSLERLLMHLWPSTLLLAGLATRQRI